jgi:hypothetical protein
MRNLRKALRAMRMVAVAIDPTSEARLTVVKDACGQIRMRTRIRLSAPTALGLGGPAMTLYLAPQANIPVQGIMALSAAEMLLAALIILARMRMGGRRQWK